MVPKECAEDSWVATVTVGERGQIVIPADARKKLAIGTGDRLIAMRHPSGEGLLLFKVGAMRGFLNNLATGSGTDEESAPGKSGNEV